VNDGKTIHAIKLELREMCGEAVTAFGAELQARRPPALDDEEAHGQRVIGERLAQATVRIAAAMGDEVFLREVVAVLAPFLAAEMLNVWAAQGARSCAAA
jgi:hypothetical protein